MGAEGERDEAAKLMPTRTHDEEGEGEEGEETTHAVKAKVYKMLKTKDESKWGDMGIGRFYVLWALKYLCLS